MADRLLQHRFSGSIDGGAFLFSMILAIETSSAQGSVALGEWNGIGQPGPLIWHAGFVAGRARGGELFRALEDALKKAAGKPLEAIIVGLGPGSYSGVRLAISAASGLALATGACLLGRPSFEALATDAPAYHVLGDARRGLFYYAAVEGGQCVRGPELLDLAGTRARIAEAMEWPVFAEVVPLGSLPITAVCLPDAVRFLGRRANFEEMSAHRVTLEPLYLRPPNITLPRAR